MHLGKEAGQRAAELVGKNPQKRPPKITSLTELLTPEQKKALEEKREKEKDYEYLGIENLKEQYLANQELLVKKGLIEMLSTGDLGIKAINGKENPLPSLEQIKERLEANKELIEKKAKQGFTQLLIVPFGLPVKQLMDTYSNTIKEHKANGTLKGANGDDLELDQDMPLWVWDKYTEDKGADIEGKLVYYPKEFDKNNHQGKSKGELLAKDPNLAFNILLVHQNPLIPRKGQGRTTGDRPELEAGQSAREYLDLIHQPGTPYQGEQGLTPEDWLYYATLHLERTNRVLNDWQAQIPDPKDPKKLIDIDSTAYLTGAYLPGTDQVPDAYWNRNGRRADLSGGNPGNRDGDYGAGVAVRVP